MKGIPENITTRQDALNSFEFVRASSDEKLKVSFARRLEGLKKMKTKKVLKANAKESTDPVTGEKYYAPDQFEDVADPHSQFAMSGLTEKEINDMISALGVSL